MSKILFDLTVGLWKTRRIPVSVFIDLHIFTTYWTENPLIALSSLHLVPQQSVLHVGYCSSYIV